jgi:hypothetical protein
LKFADRHKLLTAACAEAAVSWESLSSMTTAATPARRMPRHDIGDVDGIAETRVDIGDDRGIPYFAITRIISRWTPIARILALGMA